ncbi:DNA helicase [Lentibacillus sp. JNUCC-1]|uniref:Holliday junction branch migration protein RuvA n=1 Tax=Lentibacillus sp. JNUCC-1 TaxID=2654513 RepID=UPI0012E706AA|nr:Holliday junction branch migration protein RuvA [Lentibacillus sp. JNUCC-1]MUV39515.1 DNA helicase [Lentibacillus sp. JNUCC-1]
MIAYIQGILTDITDESVVVDVHGIGYEIICPNPYIFQGSVDQPVKIHTYQHVREDAMILYGFKNTSLKDLFIKLISVSGIGPKGAVNILGAVDVSEFAAAVEREDKTFLTKFPGVGKKTAQQIILDLKGKLTSMLTAVESVPGKTVIYADEADSHLVDMKEALKALGYTEREIDGIMPELHKQPPETTDAAVRQALVLLTKN